ncbi:unnamed protein product [Lasius platythorax]|uniref:Uncharacterized protein n=1 Tax=Lasius platythorax TaxID=488582 RepID=A0AAV2N5G4_9HYME
MGKLVLLLCLTFLAMTLVMACTPPGAPCTTSSDCCGGWECNPSAHRCTKVGPKLSLRIQELISTRNE